MWWRRSGAAALLVSVTAAGCGPGHVERAARQGRAAAEDRPLVVEFWATWCGPCKYFEQYTLTDERVKRALADVRFLRIDGDKEPGEMRKCGVTSYPTFVVLSEDGRVVAQLKGRAGAAGFIDFLQWGAPNAFDEAVIARRMAERPSVRGLLYQARLHAMKGHLPRSAAAYRKAMEVATDATRRADIEWELALLESAGGTVGALAARAATFATEHPTAANALGAAEIAIATGTLAASEVQALAKESDLRAALEANRKRFAGPPGNTEPALKGTRARVGAVLRRYRIGPR